MRAPVCRVCGMNQISPIRIQNHEYSWFGFHLQYESNHEYSLVNWFGIHLRLCCREMSFALSSELCHKMCVSPWSELCFQVGYFASKSGFFASKLEDCSQIRELQVGGLCFQVRGLCSQVRGLRFKSGDFASKSGSLLLSRRTLLQSQGTLLQVGGLCSKVRGLCFKSVDFASKSVDFASKLREPQVNSTLRLSFTHKPGFLVQPQQNISMEKTKEGWS